MEGINFKLIKKSEENTEIKSKPKEENHITNLLEFEKIPPVPTVLKKDKYASAEWKRAIKELIKKNMINQLDLKPLEVLCKSYSRWRAVEEKIDTLDEFLASDDTEYYVTCPNCNREICLNKLKIIARKGEQDDVDK